MTTWRDVEPGDMILGKDLARFESKWEARPGPHEYDVSDSVICEIVNDKAWRR